MTADARFQTLGSGRLREEANVRRDLRRDGIGRRVTLSYTQDLGTDIDKLRNARLLLTSRHNKDNALAAG